VKPAGIISAGVTLTTEIPRKSDLDFEFSAAHKPGSTSYTTRRQGPRDSATAPKYRNRSTGRALPRIGKPSEARAGAV